MTGTRNPPLLSALRSDASEFLKVKGAAGAGRSGIFDVLTLPGFWAVALWRLGNALHERGLRPLSRLTYFANIVLFGADLPAGAVVGPGLVMPHPNGVAMASDVVIGERCRVMRGVGVGGSGKEGRSGHPVIGDHVWLLDRAAVFGPVRIGDRVVIGASTIVTRDIPSEMLVLLPKSAGELRILPRTDLKPAVVVDKNPSSLVAPDDEAFARDSEAAARELEGDPTS
jgi:serine O-acetyltransferase